MSKACQGTGGSETIYDITAKDRINPYGGDDTVYGKERDDSAAHSSVAHSFGNDTLSGGPGNDTLRGGRGSDSIYGGPGADLIDCAYLESRGDTDADTACYDSEDTVVNCKDRIPDPTS